MIEYEELRADIDRYLMERFKYRKSLVCLDDRRLYSMNVFLKGIFILRNGKSIEQALTELSTQIEAIPGQISMKVTEEVGKMQIGGRNYLKKSGDWKESSFNGGWTSNGGGCNIDNSVTFNGKPTLRTIVGAGIHHEWIKLENDVEYTYSAMIKSDQDIAGNWSVPLHYWAGKDNINEGKISVIKYDTSLIANEWKLLTLTFKLSQDADSFLPYIHLNSAVATFWIAYTKLEKGNKATDWTPAPEDIETRMSQAELSLKPENIWMGIKSNIQFGGRNYFKKNTPIAYLYGTLQYIERMDSINGLHLIGESGGNSAIRLQYVIDSNGLWTVSFDIKGTQGTNGLAFRLDVCDNPEITTNRAAEVCLTSDNEYHHHEYTFNVQNYSSNVYNFVDFENLGWLYIYVRNLKIEKGSVATDWTPAPEDIGTQLADTGIDIANRKIVLSADKTVFRNNSGGQIAVFENDRIKADLIDARQIVVNGLNAGKVTAGNLNVTDGAEVGPFVISSGGYMTADNKVSMLGMTYGGRSAYLSPGELSLYTEAGSALLITGGGHITLNGNQFNSNCSSYSFSGGAMTINNSSMNINSPATFLGAISVNVRKVYGSTLVWDSDYFIVCYNTSSMMLTLPGLPQEGRTIVAKRMNNAHIEVHGGVNQIFASSALSSVGIVRTGQVQRFTFDGRYWLREIIENG